MKSMKKGTKAATKSASKPVLTLPLETAVNSKQFLRITEVLDTANVPLVLEKVGLIQETATLLISHKVDGVDLPEGVDMKMLSGVIKDALAALRPLTAMSVQNNPEVVAASKPTPPPPPTKSSTERSADKEAIAARIARQGGVIVAKDGKVVKPGSKTKPVASPATPTTTKKGTTAPTKAVTTSKIVTPAKPIATAPKKDATATAPAGKPYGKFGLHGHNIEHELFAKGEQVAFDLKGERVIGEFVHVHVNNHSPNGYAVIKRDGKIYERVLDKVYTLDVVSGKEAHKLPKPE